MSVDAERKKQEYLALLAKAPARANRLEGVGREIIQAARLTQDFATPIFDLIAQLPADQFSLEQWDQLIAQFRALLDAAEKLETFSLGEVSLFAATSYAFASTGSTSMLMVTMSKFPQTPGIQVVQGQVSRILERTPLVDAARASMQRLGLDRRGGGNKTAVDLLEEASAALRSAGEAAAILIPLRESINVALEGLIRRRSTQEPASGIHGKLTSLGRHCALPNLQPSHFDALAADAAVLFDELADAKQAGLSRQDVSDRFHRGVLFLDALLRSIDETRLK